MENAFRHLERFRRWSRVWWSTDGRAAVSNSAIYRPALKCELIGCTESNRIVFFSGESSITRGKQSADSLFRYMLTAKHSVCLTWSKLSPKPFHRNVCGRLATYGRPNSKRLRLTFQASILLIKQAVNDYLTYWMTLIQRYLKCYNSSSRFSVFCTTFLHRWSHIMSVWRRYCLEWRLFTSSLLHWGQVTKLRRLFWTLVFVLLKSKEHAVSVTAVDYVSDKTVQCICK